MDRLMRDVDYAEDCAWGERGTRKSLYLPLNFAVNLKLLFKKGIES